MSILRVFVLCGILATTTSVEILDPALRALSIPQPNFSIPFDLKLPEQLSGLCAGLNRINVSEGCLTQVDIVCRNTTLFLTMVDASSKIYPGLTFSSPTDMGNYDQCVSIDHKENNVRILGKYCYSGFVIPTLFEIADYGAKTKNATFQLATCIPDACSAQDLSTLFRLPLFFDRVCSTAETGIYWDGGDIVVGLIFGIFGLAMVVSTGYDIYLQKFDIKSIHPLLVAFSVLTNGKKILHTSKLNREQVGVFNGIKFISMIWILAGHNFVFWQAQPVSNYLETVSWRENMNAFYISASYLAVDTFFYISGFLLSYNYLKQEIKPLAVQIKKVPFMYIHRYLRLTPPVLMLYLYSITIARRIGQGPVYAATQESVAEICRRRWWPYFLYIQNYYNRDDMCLVPTWYLSADMQIFIASPLIVIPVALQFKRKYNWVITQLLSLNVIFTILPIVFWLVFRDYQNEFATHDRLIDYFSGFLLGVYMRRNINKPFKISSLYNLAIWSVILLGMTAIVLCYQEIYMHGDYVTTSVFHGLMRPAWCIGLSWIVFSCQNGYGGIINWILTRQFFQVGSRLTYSMYLMHQSVLFYHIGITLRNKTYFSDWVVFYDWCGHFTISILVSVLWTLAFESPILIIEKFIFGGGNRKPLTKSDQMPKEVA